MYSRRRKILSQNFFHNRKLVKTLIRKSSIGTKDTVIDIGAGKGIITEQLIRRSQHVIAIELDASLCSYLQKKFFNVSNLCIVQTDFLKYPLPKYPYKVFANIPFSIEGKIVRKLLTASNPPDEACLVMRDDLARRLGGFLKECQFSIMYKPWFQFEIIHKFKKTDFQPYARMDTVLFRISKKNQPLLPWSEKLEYLKFLDHGYGHGRSIKHNVSCYYTKEELSRLANKYKFSVNDKPSHLNLMQWIKLYNDQKERRGGFN